MDPVHRCKSMDLAEIWLEISEGECVLNINRVATEEDLEQNSYLEEVGQIIEFVGINVKFCPYCGEKIHEPSSEFIPSFSYSNFSKW